MNENEIHTAEWPEEVRQRLAKVYEPVVRWISQHIHVHIEDVENAAHEVLRHLQNGQVSRIRDWERYLTRATINKLRRPQTAPKIMLFRELSKDELERVFQIPAPGVNPADEAANRELYAILRAEIEKLPPRQREVMTLVLEGLSPKEIKVRLGLKKVSTVSSNRRKAMAKLKKIFRLLK